MFLSYLAVTRDAITWATDPTIHIRHADRGVGHNFLRLAEHTVNINNISRKQVHRRPVYFPKKINIKYSVCVRFKMSKIYIYLILS